MCRLQSAVGYESCFEEHISCIYSMLCNSLGREDVCENLRDVLKVGNHAELLYCARLTVNLEKASDEEAQSG